MASVQHLQQRGTNVAILNETGEQVKWPQPHKGDQFFVLKHSEGIEGQDYARSYVTALNTPNAQRLKQAVESEAAVYTFIYRLAPDSSLTAWAQVTTVTEHPDYLAFTLEGHEFPVPVHYRGSMSDRLPWVANLGRPGLAIQSISQGGFNAVVDWAKELARLLELARANATRLAANAETKKNRFNNTAYLLLENAPEKTLHLKYEILAIMQRVPELKIEAINPETWLHRVMAEDKRFQNQGNNSNVWLLVDGATSLPDDNNGDGAGIIELEPPDHTSIAPHSPGQPATTPSSLDGATDKPPETPPVVEPEEPETIVDAPLRVLSKTELDGKLRELSQELLFDESIVRRIYRSLISGHHVVLSGPPGTGKTELAKRLPGLLWREDVPEQLREDTGDTDDARQAAAQKEPGYEGYYSYVVTATEDWGVLNVIGGIGPHLTDKADGSQGLSYAIIYGELTRAILQNYRGTEQGQKLPPDTTNPVRVVYTAPQQTDQKPRQYRGVWLVIDEFTRAPVDAALGSLLTTLGSSDGKAYLAVPTNGNQNIGLLLPQDFRIIGTLNSYDRHFLNQISEALKRRFDFIDVPPPAYELAQAEQGIAIKRALEYLTKKAFVDLISALDAGNGEINYQWDNNIQVTLLNHDYQGIARPVYDPANVADNLQNPEVRAALESFWQIFEAIRVFRQLGTAQAVAVYTSLFAGGLTDMAWPVALDSALADSLADQLQVLNQDEQEILLAYLQYADNETAFKDNFGKIWQKLSIERQRSLAHTLREAQQFRQANVTTISEPGDALDPAAYSSLLNEIKTALPQIFKLGSAIALPQPNESIFYRRLRNLLYERGL